MLIIGIVTAGVVLSINFAGHDTELENESKRLLTLMKYAREQAELQTRDYGVIFGQHGYEFVVYSVRRGQWRLVSEDDALRQRTLPSGLDFKLIVDAQAIVLNDSLPTEEDSDADADAIPVGGAGTGASRTFGSSSASQLGAGAGESGGDSGSNSDSDSDSGVSSFAPQVLLLSSGDLSSFQITIERPDAGRSITLDENANGDIVEKSMVEGGS